MTGNVTGTIVGTSGTLAGFNSTTGTIVGLNSTTGTIATGTVSTLNSTTGTITTLNSTTGTITNLAATTSTFLGTITGSTNVVNIGSGQIYKDGSGNVGIGTTSPNSILTIAKSNTSTSIGSSLAVARIINTASSALNETSGIEFFNNSVGGSGKLAGVYGLYEGYNTTGYAGALVFATESTGSSNVTERLRIDSSGNVGIGNTAPVNKLDVVGSFCRGAPVTKTGDFTLADTENWIIVNKGSAGTATLPAASSWTGREFTIKVITAHTVVSASSNVVPRNSATAGTAILAAAAGNWATLVSNGTNWVAMCGS